MHFIKQCIWCLKVSLYKEFSIKVTITYINCSWTPVCACVPWLPSLQCHDDWVSPLDWFCSCSTIPHSTVRNHLVSLGLLQSNWPFKEGLHHVKHCNWEWYSCYSSTPFCPPFLLFLSFFRLHLLLILLPHCTPTPTPSFVASCSLCAFASQHHVHNPPCLQLTSKCSMLPASTSAPLLDKAMRRWYNTNCGVILCHYWQPFQ